MPPLMINNLRYRERAEEYAELRKHAMKEAGLMWVVKN